MMLIKCLKYDLRRVCTGWFLLGMLLTAGVVALNIPWENIQTPSVLYFVWNAAWGSYVQLIFICGVVPFGTTYLVEAEHHYMKYTVLRTRLKSYLRSKVLVTACSGFLAVFLGKLLFAGGMRLLFPVATAGDLRDPDTNGIYALIGESVWEYLCADAFLYGMAAAFFALLALLISAITRNVFVTIMSPMVLFFAITSISQWIQIPQWLEINGLMMGYIEIYKDSVSATLLHIIFIWIVMGIAVGEIFVHYCERRFQNE